jgi:tetratricopeptide (TPR) repeat protein
MRLLAVFLFGGVLLVAQDARSWMNRGVREYRSARYTDAVDAFQKAVDLEPGNINARLYLAKALMTQYIPENESPDNLELARKAEAEFQRVLSADPANTTALESLASFAYQQAQGTEEPGGKLKKLDEAIGWYQRLLTADPQNKAAYYSLGVIDWIKWYSAWMRARADLHMLPEQPGPLPDASMRHDLQGRFGNVIDDGISNLNRALQIDPQYDNAMVYMNLFIRERADLRDTADEYKRDVALADEWVEKALATKKAKAQAARENAMPAPPPPPPPPSPAAIVRVPPGSAPAPSGSAPQRIRVDGAVQAQKLIRRVDPIYPTEKGVRVQGVVRFIAIIAKDGTIANLQLISGHPMLVEPARQAIMQWTYRPTLLNGELVEVVTTIDVNFSLPE